MVEVVQDLLDHVTYAGGVGRRRADAVRGLGAGTPKPGASDCALVSQESSEGPQIVKLQDLVFNVMMDKPVHLKEYRLQLEEFSFRGERLIDQLDHKMNEVTRLVQHDVLLRSRELPQLLREVCDEMRQVQVLICQELEEVWHMKFELFFYPSDDEVLPGGMPGGWLDLDDMFLSAHLLQRHLNELIGVTGALVRQMPRTFGSSSRSQIRAQGPLPAASSVAEHAAARVPWLGVSMASGRGESARGGERCETPPEGSGEGENLPLNKAITSLDTVLTVHMKNLLSNLHRTTYQTFVRLCAAYTRWKLAFADERAAKLAEIKDAEEAERELRKRKNKVNMKAWKAVANAATAVLVTEELGDEPESPIPESASETATSKFPEGQRRKSSVSADAPGTAFRAGDKPRKSREGKVAFPDRLDGMD